MVWFFERGPHTASLEVRRGHTGFEVIVRRPEGHAVIHVARDAADVLAHVETAPRSLMEEGWRPRLKDPLEALRGSAPARRGKKAVATPSVHPTLRVAS
jgi:hypothetical protein